ncbi:hypothetical protein DM790_07240 [Flavobacterium collinsii]|nr:hypothetical protein [Flavobacterium collinsii]
MKKYKKTFITIITCFLIVIMWNYFKKPITIKEERATNVPIKFSVDLNEDWEKVINVYIPPLPHESFRVEVCRSSLIFFIKL